MRRVRVVCQCVNGAHTLMRTHARLIQYYCTMHARLITTVLVVVVVQYRYNSVYIQVSMILIKDFID